MKTTSDPGVLQNSPISQCGPITESNSSCLYFLQVNKFLPFSCPF